MNYEELKEALKYANEHREEVLGETSAILSVVVSKDNDGVIVVANGDDKYIIKALYASAKKHKRFASIIIEAAEMIKAEMTKLN